MKKALVFLAAGLIAVLLLAGYSAPQMRMSVLDIGKADAVLITLEGHAVLIDTGTAKTAETVLQALEAQNITALDALIITHFDQDHIGGAAAVLQEVSVRVVYQPDYKKSTTACKVYQQALEDYGGTLITVRAQTEAEVGDMRFVIQAPQGSMKQRSSNDHSLVTALYYGKTSFLLPGDAAQLRIQELLEADVGCFDVLKVPHHGILEENSLEFIQMVSPKYAVVTTPNQAYADEAIIAQLNAVGADVRSTCGGTVHYFSNGTVVCAAGGCRQEARKNNCKKTVNCTLCPW